MPGDHVDDRGGQLLDVGALLLGVNAPHVGLIEQLLQLDVGHRGDQIEQRQALADPGDELGGAGWPASPGLSPDRRGATMTATAQPLDLRQFAT